MSGVDLGMGLFNGLPIRNRRYNGGSSHDRAGRGINSAKKIILIEPCFDWNEFDESLCVSRVVYIYSLLVLTVK